MLNEVKVAIDLRYAIRISDKYVQEIEPNDDYVYGACSPTMGVCHSYSEYTVILGDVLKSFERLTASNYLKILFEEFRWGEKPYSEIVIEPIANLERKNK